MPPSPSVISRLRHNQRPRPAPPISSGQFAITPTTLTSATPPPLPTPTSSSKTQHHWLTSMSPWLTQLSTAVATDVTHLARKSKGKSGGTFADCISTLGDATDLTTDSLGQLQQMLASRGGDFNAAMDTVLMKMRAAMTNEGTCLDEYEEEPEGLVKKQVVDPVKEAKKFTSIALAFVNYYAKNGSP